MPYWDIITRRIRRCKVIAPTEEYGTFSNPSVLFSRAPLVHLVASATQLDWNHVRHVIWAHTRTRKGQRHVNFAKRGDTQTHRQVLRNVLCANPELRQLNLVPFHARHVEEGLLQKRKEWNNARLARLGDTR